MRSFKCTGGVSAIDRHRPFDDGGGAREHGLRDSAPLHYHGARYDNVLDGGAKNVRCNLDARAGMLDAKGKRKCVQALAYAKRLFDSKIVPRASVQFAGVHTPADHPWRTMPFDGMTPHIFGTSLSA
jgi:hypothetical protein